MLPKHLIVNYHRNRTPVDEDKIAHGGSAAGFREIVGIPRILQQQRVCGLPMNCVFRSRSRSRDIARRHSLLNAEIIERVPVFLRIVRAHGNGRRNPDRSTLHAQTTRELFFSALFLLRMQMQIEKAIAVYHLKRRQEIEAARFAQEVVEDCGSRTGETHDENRSQIHALKQPP